MICLFQLEQVSYVHYHCSIGLGLHNANLVVYETHNQEIMDNLIF